jgi:hypothetical protein
VSRLLHFPSKTQLDTQSIQVAIRSSLAHIRQSRIAPSAITAPPHGFVPPSLGVGLPRAGAISRGLQEERVDRDVWVGILDALSRLTAAQAQASESSSHTMDT